MRPTRRTLTLADGMVMVAVAAVALWICRNYNATVLEPGPGLHRGMSFMEGWHRAYRKCCGLLVGGVILAAALLALRVREPRPFFRRLMRQPGDVACGAVLFVVALRGLGLLWGALLAQVAGLRWHQMVFDLEDIDLGWTWVIIFSEVEQVAPQMCLAVAVTWVVLALGGRWRPEPSWIDRTGRALGLFYIIIFPLFLWSLPFPLHVR